MCINSAAMWRMCYFFGCFSILIAGGVPAEEQSADEVISLSHHPQLFLDDHLIANTVNLKREMQQPVRHPENPLIRQDYPWEKRMIEVYGTVLFDDDQKKYRCWYVAAGSSDGVFDTPEGPVTAEYFQCYAESDDGVAWTKPLSSAKKFRDYERHNVVIPGGHGFCVLPTPDDPDPARKFKGAGGAVFGFSPDGIDWTLHNWRDAIGKNDTGTSIVRWNGEYLAYVRYQIQDPQWPGVMRGVGLSVSTDFEKWTPKKLVFQTDDVDGYPWTQPYGISVTPYGDQLIGLLWLIHLNEGEANNRHGDMDVQLMTSCDGRTWHRAGDRQPILKPVPESWEAGSVFPGTTLLLKDDMIHIYYTGKTTRHGTPGTTGIGLATLPADRFLALQPDDKNRISELQTRLFTAEGKTLLVNADVAEGDLQIELLGADGQVIPGFTHESSRLERQDALRWGVTWSNGTSTNHFGDRPPNQPFALRFLLRDGSLFAFQVRGE